jgi:hypothetical protein
MSATARTTSGRNFAANVASRFTSASGAAGASCWRTASISAVPNRPNRAELLDYLLGQFKAAEPLAAEETVVSLVFTKTSSHMISLHRGRRVRLVADRAFVDRDRPLPQFVATGPVPARVGR